MTLINIYINTWGKTRGKLKKGPHNRGDPRQRQVRRVVLVHLSHHKGHIGDIAHTKKKVGEKGSTTGPPRGIFRLPRGGWGHAMARRRNGCPRKQGTK